MQNPGSFFFSTFALLCLFLVSLVVPAANSARAETVLKTIGDDLASPVTTPALKPFLIGAGLTVGLYLTRTETSFPVQRNITSDRPLNRWAKLGDVTGKMVPNLIYAGLALASAAFGHERGLVRAEEMALASVYSGLVTSLIKVTAREGRPNNPADKKSFPSGHSTTAFAFAGVVGAEHPLYFSIPAYILAVNCAYSRINDNKHYLHDVVGGATIGLSYALGVYYNRQKRDQAAAAGKSRFTVPMYALVPSADLSGAMFGAAIPF